MSTPSEPDTPPATGVDITRRRLNLDALRHLPADLYAVRLNTHPDTPIVLDGVTTLTALRAAVAEGYAIDVADHQRRAETLPGYDLTSGEDRVQRSRDAVDLVENSSAALRELLDKPYWRLTQATQLSGKVAVQALTALLDLTDEAERQAIRWSDPFAVPEWIADVRAVIARTLHANRAHVTTDGA